MVGVTCPRCGRLAIPSWDALLCFVCGEVAPPLEPEWETLLRAERQPRVGSRRRGPTIGGRYDR